MPRDPRLYLDDILEAIQQIRLYTEGYTEQTFYSDRKTQDAVIRNLEIICEAAGNLPDDIRNTALDIEWRKIIGLRNILAHQYFGISLPIVWDIVHNKLEALETGCQSIMKHLGN